MRAVDSMTAALLMLLSAAVIYQALRLGAGWGSEGPESGFFPFWLAILLAMVSIVLFVQALRIRSQEPFVTRKQLVPVLKVLGPLAGFVLITDPPGPWSGLGLYVAAGLYLGFYMRWVGGHDWRTVVALATLIPVLTFLIFETWFLVPMPKGPVESWFGY
ncbi:MAG TPA: tripartite tricarboxylate transporter TctB family protein [Candidatus Binatia bacterium]